MRTKTLRRLAPALCALALAGISARASAQASPGASPALALDRFYPAPAGDRMFGVQSPHVAGDLTPHFSTVATYAHNPLVLREGSAHGEPAAVVDHQMLLHLNGSLAVGSRLLFNVAFPIALYQSGESPTVAGHDFVSPDSAEIGDLRLGLRVRLFGEATDPVQLALGGYLWAPTGRSEDGSFVGEGTVRGLPQVIVGGRVADRMVWSFNAGPDLRAAKTFGGPNGLAQGTMIRLDGGLGVLLGDARHLQIGAEGRAAFLVDNPSGRSLLAATNVEAMLGVRYRFLGDIEAGAGVGPGISMGLGTPDVRALAMVSYSPETVKEAPRPKGIEPRVGATPGDMDGDFIPDAVDACPVVQGTRSTDPKLHGCADTDDDGLRDPVDACPMIKGVASAVPEHNGCPDVDADGIPDMQDACLTVRGVPSSDPDKRGCPDRDGDGVVDTKDACLTVPGIESAEVRKNGCPRDSDDDGIIDIEDACPGLVGLATDDRMTHGCPGDTDRDGVRDDVDACIHEKGKASRDATKNGCPEGVRVTATEIVMLRQVEFAIAKAAIKPTSDALLDEIAQVLREHPELEKIELQSHTDDTGKASFNKALSQERAESVKAALVRRGVAESQIVPKGYGQEKPVFDNRTEEGRQKNRRLQIVILRKASK